MQYLFVAAAQWSDAACFGALGYNDSSIVLEARDLWAHKALVRLDNLP